MCYTLVSTTWFRGYLDVGVDQLRVAETAAGEPLAPHLLVQVYGQLDLAALHRRAQQRRVALSQRKRTVSIVPAFFQPSTTPDH